MVVKKSTRSSFETTWGRERQWPQQAWVRAGGRILTEEKGVWDQEVMLCKTQWGSKVVGGWVCTGVCQRESLVGIKAPSLTHASTSPVCFFFEWLGCVCVFVEPLQYRGLITPQDASAASGGLRAGGTLFTRECGFFSVWQDSQPQSHTGQERRVRSWDMRGGVGVEKGEDVWRVQNVRN